MISARLPFDDGQTLDARIAARDAAARARAVDPRFNVALEASAGTGKTRVLVDRYINLLRAGVDPANILAVTFTRKAAAEMRDRIMTTLRTAAARGEIPAARWRDLRDRTADIAVSTIDAFCLSLLREFPLEADLDPGFTVADDTVLPRLIEEALDATFRTCRAVARADDDVALVLAHLGERRARAAIGSLLDRRLVAPAVLARGLSGTSKQVDAAGASRAAGASLVRLFGGMRGGLDEFLRTGPLDAGFELLAQGLRQLTAAATDDAIPAELVPVVFARARAYFLTQDRKPRSRSPHPQRVFANRTDWQVHAALVVGHSEAFARLDLEYRRGLNVPLTRGLLRMFRIAERGYRQSLEAHALLDFPDLVFRALELLRRMDEFSRSRYRLESRYHHVLVDEFQDTSRAQWEMVSLLIQSWGEGAGLPALGPLPPSVFIVGDRKQSIYAFRDADVSILRKATRQLERLRPEGDVRRSISRSFRAVPSLLAFVNDVCHEMNSGGGPAAFEYDETDRFPVEPHGSGEQAESLGLMLEATPDACAETVAAEIGRLLATGTPVRDRDAGVARPVRAGDVAILFRSRDSHREFEAALTNRGIPSYVYKGLGFFDADEIKDLLALIRYLADPASNLRAAALLRSRFFGLSDEALRLLAPRIAEAMVADESFTSAHSLSNRDVNALVEARASTSRWRALVDRVGPAELVDQILIESAYAFELRGFRMAQARENLKKLRSLLRRLQNHGYATMRQVAAHLDRVSVGDESNAVLDAVDSVNLMTVHASKGLEFPVVFVVNLCRGTGGRRGVVRWSSDSDEEVPMVAVGESDPEVDDACDAKEREETKRLVYVALTRARDRLYLSSSLRDAKVLPARGSLGEVLPHSLLQALEACNSRFAEWRAPSGAVHRMNKCAHPGPHQLAPVTTLNVPVASDFAPLGPGCRPARTVGEISAAEPARPFAAGAERERLTGVLLHQLLQRHGFGATPEHLSGEPAFRELQTIDPAAAAGALEAYHAICGHPDVRDLHAAVERLHEVPFTMRVDGTIVRGTIDCLVRLPPNRVVVLEFKTGQPQPEHQTQLELYRRAAQRLFPDATVDGRLVYAVHGTPAS